MTVESLVRSQTFQGGQGVLTFNFRTIYNQPSYIQVNVVALTGGTITPLVYNVGYTVVVNSSGVGGTVTVSPTYSTAYNYVVYRLTPLTQNSAYTDYNQFPAATLENNLDQLTIITQENSDNYSRSVQVPIGTTPTVSTQLPLPVPQTLLGWDATGTLLTNVQPATLNFIGISSASSLGVSDAIVPTQHAVKTYVDTLTQYNVKNYGGAKGDGVTDDTTAIQNTINIAESNGSTVIIPQGTYKISSSLLVSNPVNIIGSGHIASATSSGTGTLLWYTGTGSTIIIDGITYNASSCYLSSFDIVSNNDGILLMSPRNILTDVHVVAGTKGWGFVLDGAYENRLFGCMTSTNGYSAQSYSTGYTGIPSGGFYLVKKAQSYGPNASELHGCIVEGCQYGVYVGPTGGTTTLGTYINVFGGTFEGNVYNIYVYYNNGQVNFYGSHLESPSTSSVVINNSSYVNFFGVGCYGTAPSVDVQLTSSSNCSFNGGTLFLNLNIDANSNNNTFINNRIYDHTLITNSGSGNSFINSCEFDNSDLRVVNTNIVTQKSLLAISTTASTMVLTAGSLVAGAIFQTTSSTASTLTLDNGTNISSAFVGKILPGYIFSFIVANTSTQTTSVLGSTGVTCTATFSVLTLQSRTFYAVNTGTNLWSIY